MNFDAMNDALQKLRDKYAVPLNGRLVPAPADSIGVAAELELNGGRRVKLLPWRIERRFVELKKMVDTKILEDVSTLRFAWLTNCRTLKNILYRELDLCAYLGESEIRSIFAVLNGNTANLIVKLFDDKSCSVECSAALPATARELDRHELIARRGVACDRTVDTQVPQDSIYEFTAQGEKRYTDIDTELFGFETAEILLIRAAYAVLNNLELAPQWNAIHTKLTRQVADALVTEKNGKPVIYPEGK